MIRLLLSLIGFKWTCESPGVSAILSLVGRRIQLTKAPPQEQLETISSSRLMLCGTRSGLFFKGTEIVCR